MLVGTFGSFLAIIFANQNGEVASSQELEIQKQIEEFQKQQAEQAKANRPLEGYTADPFEASTVSTLEKIDLVPGEGQEVPAGATVKVSYFGWKPDGTIFDSTNQNGTNTPRDGFTLREGGLIEGWVQGIPGMKVGGVRKLVIPAGLAYDTTGNPSANIAPDTPLTFIIKVEAVEQ